MSSLKTPWLPSYGDVSFHLDYPDYSMSEAVFATAEKYPDYTALSYMGKKFSYATLVSEIDRCAKAFQALGITAGQKVCLCLPNVPQTVFCLYALNRIGAIPAMIHPLSAVGEIIYYLKETDCKTLVTLDQFYHKAAEVQETISLDHLIITTAADALGWVKRTAFQLFKNKAPRLTSQGNLMVWNDFLALGRSQNNLVPANSKANDPALILFSGGTTGVTKAILLSNLNLNALAYQTMEMCHCSIVGNKMLAAMPMFHGFGLGICVHTMLVAGGTSVLVPRFTPQEYARLIVKEKTNFIAGVPTLFQVIISGDELKGKNLDFLMGVFSGGDSLPIELKKRIDKFLEEHGATVRVREGYGTTECVTASCLTPYHKEVEGSIGLPYPDTYYQICKVGTTEEVPFGEDGEICLFGPSVMLGYLNHPEENAHTLQVHPDGRTWLHTGDMGSMDENGFIYFRQRIKRMIITSGYNVYPSQLEDIIDQHEAVQLSCVIGVKDPVKMQKIKAFVVLREGYEPTPELLDSLKVHCKKNIAKYALPYDIEIRKSLPKTLVGKIAYTVLEEEEAKKQTV